MPPQKLKNAAIIQLVGGIIDLLFGWGLASMVGGCLGTIITSPCMCIGIPAPGALCGMLGFLVIPIALLELGSGIYGMTNPKAAGGMMKIVSFIQMGGLLTGSLTSAIGGVVAYMQLADPEVTAYLTGP